MRVIGIAVFLLLSAATLFAQEPSYSEAERLFNAGEYSKAEAVLNSLLSSSAENAEAYRLMGDVLGKQEKFRQAAKNYEKAIELNPEDKKAIDSLHSLRLDRGLKIESWVGAWEVDYTRFARETALSYKGINDLELAVGHNYTDEINYKKYSSYLKGTYSYGPDSYLKLSLKDRSFNYPVNPKVKIPTPDSTSYHKAVFVELEASQDLFKNVNATLTYELSLPKFYYDRAATIKTHKISAELHYKTPIEFLTAKLYYGLLRDIDGNTTEVKGRDNTGAGTAKATDVKYRIFSLFGGALEMSKDKFSAELKYLPNRELDDSYKYSIFTSVGYEINEAFSIKLDHLHDKYSSTSSKANKSGNVYMLTTKYKFTPELDIEAGYKYLSIPGRIENSAFSNLVFRTGLGL